MEKRARKAVEQKSSAATKAPTTFAHHFPHGRIRHQGPIPHKVESRCNGRREFATTLIFRCAEYVSGGEVASTQVLMEEFGLCALPHAWRAQQDQTPRVGVVAWSRAFGGRPCEPCSPVVLRGRVHEYTGSWNLRRMRGCARDTGYRGRFLAFVMAVTIACEGLYQIRFVNRGQKDGVRRKNETSQTQRVTGRSPEQPSPKCCSRTRLLGRAKYGNGTDGLYVVTNGYARTPKVISDDGAIRIPLPE